MNEEQKKIEEEVAKDSPDTLTEENAIQKDVVEETDSTENVNTENVTNEVTEETDETSIQQTPEENPEEKRLTQSQVNEIAARARQEGRESALKEIFNRYGVTMENEMDDVFGKGQAYDSLNDEYTGINNSYKEVLAENALLKSQIDESRWDDVKLILTGNGLEVTSENIESMLPSHPEWKGNLNAVNPAVNQEGTIPPVKPATIRRLGSDVSSKPDEMSEEDMAKKLFGFK